MSTNGETAFEKYMRVMGELQTDLERNQFRSRLIAEMCSITQHHIVRDAIDRAQASVLAGRWMFREL